MLLVYVGGGGGARTAYVYELVVRAGIAYVGALNLFCR